MARQPDIQYICYTDGSAARKFAPLEPLKTIKLPKIKPLQKRITLHIDPLSCAGILMAAVMMVLMVVGITRLNTARQELQAMDAYVQTLTAENQQLQQTFEEGYDLEVVEKTALALGFVPKEQVQHITIRVAPEIVEEEPNSWEKVYTFLTSLFA